MKKYKIEPKNGDKSFFIKAYNQNQMMFDVFNDNFTFKKLEEKQRYFFSAHLDENFVKTGDKVEKYKTQIGTIGDGNSKTSRNSMFAHDHFGCYVDLTISEFYEYVYGWDKEKVEKHYLNPHELCLDFSKIYPEIENVDIGGRGYNYLQSIKKNGVHVGYHPAVDVNDPRGGNSDFGSKIMAPCDGIVHYAKATWGSNHGWGNICIIKETK